MLIGSPRPEKPAVPLLSRDWRVLRQSPSKRVLIRYNDATDEVEILEEWLNDVPLLQAAQERELLSLGPRKTSDDLVPTVVIPQSVVSQAIREGWYHDDAKWRRWTNDPDNRRLRVSEGRV